MNRRRGGRSRQDRYGKGDEEKHGEDASTPYSLHTEGTTLVGRPQEPPSVLGVNHSVVRSKDAPPSTTASVSALHRPGVVDTDSIPAEETEPLTPSNNNNNNSRDIFRDEPEDDGDDDDDDDGESYVDYDMTLQELMYSTSSFYAIVVPVTITMILSALCVVYINNDASVQAGREEMTVYEYFDTTNMNTFQSVALSLFNGLIIVTVICMMTFVIVLLYKYNCMWCLIGYMMFASTSLLGLLGGNIWRMAIHIYKLPVDKLSFVLGVWNFAAVGVLSIFYGKGIPKYIAQGYLICTSVILAWHLSFFDGLTAWTLLFMLALYDLCAVLTPCGPLKALVNLMSRENAPEMPGLLYEAELPPEARRPGGGPPARRSNTNTNTTTNTDSAGDGSTSAKPSEDAADNYDPVSDNRSETEGPRVQLPLAVARVYNLPVVDVPPKSRSVFEAMSNGARSTDRPLLEDNCEGFVIPDDPTSNQLQSDVIVQLPLVGGRIERIRRKGRYMYLERDRRGDPKRILWVDRVGRVFAESTDYGQNNEAVEKNTIRLGLGDFIFYSVLVAKAAEYSFTTFAVCALVIIAGLGGTLVLLSVFHHALPALPISIILGIFFYLTARFFTEPWIEATLIKPYYV